MGERGYALKEKAAKLRDLRNEDALAIVACIKKHSPEKITAVKVGEEVGLSARRVWDVMYTVIKHKYPEIVSYRQDGYRWEGEGFVEPEETASTEMDVDKCYANSDNYIDAGKSEKEDLSHNAEGYNDPTAAAILKRFERADNKVRAGEIWSTGNQDLYFLVLATFPGLVVGLNICRIDTWFDPEWDVRILIGKDQYYINIKRLTSRPAKTIVANYGRIDKNRLNLIRASIGGMLNLKTVEEKIVEKPVEVIREVVKEVPVEKVIEKPVEVEKVIFKTKFDRKKLKKAHAKSYSHEKYNLLLAKYNKDQQFWAAQLAVEQAKANAWEQAFRMMATGKEYTNYG